MNEEILDEVQLERTINAHFSVTVDIDSAIVSRVPASRTAQATLFLTKKKQLYLYVDSQSALTLSDVRKIVGRMGLKAEAYLPPKGRPHYFDEVGETKFREIFPGRHNVSEQDIAFYRTLAPYRPALVLISAVLAGEVYQFDPDASTGWRIATKFAYRRIRTS
ncbi:hypothetical protein GW746_00730 [Candidatus Saccharibacteria bacterium]|nr:hypothetical protein [Candidatus Saccharibacteria bacterium]NCS82929.1 hypothetical protein [Candidatus Saccharibacteria bacterium]